VVVEAAVPGEPGLHRRLQRQRLAGDRPRDDHLVGQAVDRVDWREPAVGKARGVDTTRFRVAEGRPESERTMFGDDTAAVLAGFLLEDRWMHVLTP